MNVLNNELFVVMTISTLFILMILGFITTLIIEKRQWNNGIAPSGSNWVLFDVDSQCDRLYKDPNGTKRISISSPVDKNIINK